MDLHPVYSALVDCTMEFVVRHLGRYGEFFPLGATVQRDGSVALAAAYDGEHSDSASLIQLLTDGFTGQVAHGEILAACLCVDVLTIPPGEQEKRDAICMRLWHCDSPPIDLYFPYRRSWLRRVTIEEGYTSTGTLLLESPLELSDTWGTGEGTLFGDPAVVSWLETAYPKPDLPIRLGFAVPHHLQFGEGGQDEEHARLNLIESALTTTLADGPCLHVANVTTPHVKEFIYYAPSRGEAEVAVRRAVTSLPELQHYIEDDANWLLYQTIRNEA